MFRIIGADGQQYGPISAEQLRRWIAENRANAQTLIQPDGAPEWKPLSTFPEFAADLRPAPPAFSATPPPFSATPIPAATPPSPAAARASSKVAAGVCGILLGSLGIHKFVLGYTGAGLIMLLVTILTCGLAAGVMHIIGLIEGIIYLTKSDEDFVRTYVDGRKEWF
jgi:TM2 domain-containing membrane protein YozV